MFLLTDLKKILVSSKISDDFLLLIFVSVSAFFIFFKKFSFDYWGKRRFPHLNYWGVRARAAPQSTPMLARYMKRVS